MLKDIRDLRDPVLLGEKLLFKRKHPRNLLSERYDRIKPVLNAIPNYVGTTLGAETAKTYIAELESREDIYARNTLDSIKKGKREANAEIV